MLLLAHIIIALSSLIFTGFVFIRPSQKRLYFAYALVALTLITGTYLVVLMPAHLAKSCVSGLIYLAFVSAGIVAARHKLVASTVVK